MRKLLLFLVIPFLSYGQVQIGEDIDGISVNSGIFSSVSLSSDGNLLAIGTPFSGTSNDIFSNGSVHIYRNDNDDWVEIGEDIEGESAGNGLGASVSLSSDGSIIAIGVPGFDTSNNDVNSGNIVRIYRNDNDNWIQIGENIEGKPTHDGLGTSVSLSSDGNIVAMGAPVRNGTTATRNGYVRIYRNANDNWVQIGQDIDGEELGNFFGNTISLSGNGDMVVIAAHRNDGNNGRDSGQVRIYRNVNDNWIQIGQDINGDFELDALGGGSIDISSDGNIIAIGANGFDATNGSGHNGYVRVYRNANDNWVQIGQDIEGEFGGDRLGSSVGLSNDGSIIAIGASGVDDSAARAGQVRIYRNVNDNWVQIGEDINGEAAVDLFGGDLSLSNDGTIVAIAAPFNDGVNGVNSGHIRVYDLSSVVLSTEETTVADFSVFPNPANSTVTILLDSSDTLEQIIIYNTLGQKVLSSTQASFDISSLSAGLYILEITTPLSKGIKKLLID